LVEKIPLTAILAGGKARRMGVDKVALLLDGVPLVERVWARVTSVSEDVVAVGGAPRLQHLGVPTIPDRHPGTDSMGGIATALWYAANAADSPEWVLCVACDMPLIEPRLLSHLYRLRRGWDVVVPRVPAGYEPLCAIYRVSCLAVLEGEIKQGNLRVRDVIRAVRSREVGEKELRAFDPELRSFLNVNRPADLEMAERILRGAA
jgi:molybdopterin-guanine dinucleotide biosynthesis protein A